MLRGLPRLVCIGEMTTTDSGWTLGLGDGITQDRRLHTGWGHWPITW